MGMNRVHEIIKRQLEADIGIPYSEYEKLDRKEQERLIDKKIHQIPIKMEESLFTSEIANGYIVMRKPVKGKMLPISISSSKILRKILKPFF